MYKRISGHGRSSTPLGAGCFLGAISLFGCSAEIDQAAGSGGGPNESIAVTEEELTNCSCNLSSYKTYTAVDGQAMGPSTSDYICWPTIYDRADPSGAVPHTMVFQTGGKWKLSGSIWDNKSEMTCVKQCCFYSN